MTVRLLGGQHYRVKLKTIKREVRMANERSERAKEQAMAGYLDPGPKHLNCAPKEVIIYGIQPAVIRPPGLELSSEIAAVVPKLIKAVLEEAAKQ